MQKIRRELGVIEKATGQHGWLEIPAIDALAHDSELSRLGHAAEIHVSIFRRRLDYLEHHLNLSQQTLNELENLISSAVGLPVGLKREYEQWLRNLAMQFQLRQVDLTYYQRRVDNQITAIYGLLSQRDNMLGVSVAIESKKISEASKRDGSSLKSLTVLATLFFPASYIATLFTLPHFTKTPLWVYWTVAVPLTLLVFISWSSWTFYRQRRIARETTDQEINRDVELDPEVAFASSSNAASSTFLVSTLRQIRSHTKALNHSSVSSRDEAKGVDVGGGLGMSRQSEG
ncbi:uncharacterized protein LDX57_006673 [Aspergillus melleus]|uniref:uncharacterized protein n=1 Tax=Aspergillus melleus TaxID=138277 RepID=UPI001E8E7989|nr:uncharacterized protein LDX57_006673 [Aspergillus melleus]KAH8429002.1 hypothetical protein LDX57_006673 [Aspergillus melleus]